MPSQDTVTQNMLTQSVQDYLKTIYKLQEIENVSTTEISKEMNVSGASVTGMLKRLSAMGLVDYNSYKGVKLTEVGEKISLEIVRHHRLLELYLKEMLGFTLDKVHEEACRLEHVISREFADKINELLGDPKFDPHGHPIPTKEGTILDIKETALSDVEPGKEVVIRSLYDEDSKLLAYLEDIELLPGVKIKIIEKAPFNGPLKIEINGVEKIIGYNIADKIYIE
ncbi:MAG: metal-dependent transcriptional regulator [FCB group bacterium]|jgi:DtxR family Mn-dependent transcriptional regulator